MSVEPIPSSNKTYIIDTLMGGVKELTASFLLRGERGIMLVDTGTSECVDNIITKLYEINVKPSDIDYVLITHPHLDHAGGASTLAEKCQSAKFICHKSAIDFLCDEKKLERLVESSHQAVGENSTYYGDAKPINRERFDTVSGGEMYDLGNHSVEIIHAPGHAPHHLSLYDHTCNNLFMIDEGCIHFHGHDMPNAPPPNFNLPKMIQSISKFKKYDADTYLFSHYGLMSGGPEILDNEIEILNDWVSRVDIFWKNNSNETDLLNELYSQEVSDGDHPIVKGAIKMHINGILNYIKRKNQQ